MHTYYTNPHRGNGWRGVPGDFPTPTHYPLNSRKPLGYGIMPVLPHTPFLHEQLLHSPHGRNGTRHLFEFGAAAGQWKLWYRNDVLPDDIPVGPKHAGVIFKI